MKTVYVFWTERLNEQRGGVHRIILLLLKHLPPRGFKVRYLYTLDDYQTFHLYHENPEEEVSLDVASLKSHLVANQCDIILGQDGVFSSSLTNLVKSMAIPGVKFVNEYHNSLLLLPQKLTRDYLRFEYRHSTSFKVKLSLLLKYVFYPLWKKSVWYSISKSFRYNLLNSDVTLLLTRREEPIVKSILPKGTEVKCMAIPNPLSWETIADASILQHKKQEVLVVSRIYNPEKRIDLVLKIWKELQNRGINSDWTLRIVGDGIHRQLLMDEASKLNLINVVWEGWSDPKPFYRTASIFMMTSACEGWGLTLTESMQTGVVPLAIDTYPALFDIINDGYDGYIIHGNDVKVYADRMQGLMQNVDLRERMARNALESCKRFSTEKIMDQWAEMLASV